jgi:hypothetical protein
MSPKGVLKALFGIVVLAAIGALLAWVYVEGRKGATKERWEEEESVKETSCVSVQRGEGVVKLTKGIQSKSPIAAVSLSEFGDRPGRPAGLKAGHAGPADRRNSSAKTSHQVHARACVCPDFAPVRAVFWPKAGIVRRGWMKEQDNG